MRNWFSCRGVSSPGKKKQIRRRIQPRLEHLEDRCTPTVNVTSTFNGLKMGDPGNDAIPPDVNGAVGPDRVIETVNSSIAIYDRSGTVLASIKSDTFFNSASTTFDPFVIYDEYAKRFVMYFDEQDDNAQTADLHIAVSNTSSPSNLTTDWTEKQDINIEETIGGTATWGDFPRFGYNADAWVISLNQYGFGSSGTFQAVQVLAIDKSTYLDQNTSTHTEFKSDPNLGLFTMAPAQMHGSVAGDPIWMVSSNNGADNQIHVVKMTNILSNSPTYTDTAVTVNAYDTPGTSPQPGGTDLGGGNDLRMISAAWRGNRLVATHSVAANSTSGVGWYEFNTTSTPTKTQEGVINAGSGIGAMFGSADINPFGALGFNYMQSSNTEFLSIYVTGQNPGDPLGSTQTPVKAMGATSAYDAFDGSPFRLGDFSTVVVDPLDGSFWATNEFNDTRSSNNWATGIVHFDTGLTGGGGGGGGGGNQGNGTIHATPNPVDENHSFILDGSFSDPNGAFKAHTVSIDWGDGSLPQQIILSAGVTSFKLNYLYPDNSVYTVKATITASGFFLTDAIDVTVNNLPPTAVITGAPSTSQYEGKKISLGAKVVDPSPLDTFNYLWKVQKNGVDFTTATTAGLTFIPDDQGLYKVFLTVTDDDGGSVQASPVSINVLNLAPFADSLTNDGPKKSTEAVTVSFVNPTDAAADVAAGLKYYFDFTHDGTWDVQGSNSSSAQFTYGAPGYYTAAAQIVDKDGAASPIYLTNVTVSDTSSGNGGIITTSLVAVGSDAGRASVVRVFDKFGDNIFTLLPFPTTYLGGVRVATGDVNGDHVEDVIVANGSGLAATIKVYDGNDGSELTGLSSAYTKLANSVYPATYKSGFMIATGDINRDGYADVVVAPSTSGLPIEVINGQDGTQLAQLAHPFGNLYAKGYSVAVGDVTGDGIPDLVVGQAAGGSRVAVFAGNGTSINIVPVRNFNAFPVTFTGGVSVAAGDTNGDRNADIVVGMNAQFTFDSRVRVYSGLNNSLMKDFVVYSGYRGGVRVATEDLDGDGKADLLVTPGRYSATVGAKPRLLALKGTNLTRLQDIQLLDAAFLGGVWVG